MANDLPRLDPNLIRTIRSIASVDTIIARAALNEINDILESPEKQAALRDYEELYVDSICVQFMVNIKHFTMSGKANNDNNTLIFSICRKFQQVNP